MVSQSGNDLKAWHTRDGPAVSWQPKNLVYRLEYWVQILSILQVIFKYTYTYIKIINYYKYKYTYLNINLVLLNTCNVSFSLIQSTQQAYPMLMKTRTLFVLLQVPLPWQPQQLQEFVHVVSEHWALQNRC